MLSPNYDKVVVWERLNGQRIRKEYDPDFSFYAQHDDGKYKDIYGNNLCKLEFDNSKDYFRTRKELLNNNINLYESDIPLEQKILSTHYYNAPTGPINIAFFDIEVDYDKRSGFSGVKDPYAPVNSISIYFYNTKKRLILAVPPHNSPFEPAKRHFILSDISDNVLNFAEVRLFNNERELLRDFLDSIRDIDLISGWNSDYFDIPYIYKRIKSELGQNSLKLLSFPNSKLPTIREIEREVTKGFTKTEEYVTLFGRVSLDYKLIYEKFTQENKSSYSLDNIAKEELPQLKKLQYSGTLYNLYREDFSYYLEYNMIDTEIIVQLEEKLKYMELALELSHMATTNIDSVYKTIKTAEWAIINYCHNILGARVPDSKKHDYFKKYGGAIVLDLQQGEHQMLGAVDVESLYPSAIISVNASPETLIAQFKNNEKDYAKLVENDGGSLILEYNNGDIEERTTNEWWEYLQNNNYSISAFGTVFSQSNVGFIPAILKEWFAERKKYKKLLEDRKEKLLTLPKDDPEYDKIKAEKDLYHRFQYIKKIQLNSLYGCMGNKYFKFFDIRLAESTTKTGREILYHMAKQISKELGGDYVYPNDAIIYGDTDSCYFKTYTDNLSDAKRLCKYIETKVNESFPNFMKNKFLCHGENANKIRIQNELISDLGIFVSKKIYLLHLVYKDGYDVDEVKFMGHAVKKTTLTDKVKVELTRILTKYFNIHDWTELNKDVVKFKQMLYDSKDINDIGIPGKVNKVEYYMNELMANPKVSLPGKQAAALCWNIYRDAASDVESIQITSGMPVKTYYLTKPMGRFISISVPAELKILPQWFIDDFIPIIDIDRQIFTLIDQTLTNICNAVGKLVPTEKAVLADDILVF